jgi:Na+-transporting NADH:ubiquinone oxidoreductase subunit B/electron transport complex protein RnfD
MLTRWLNPVTGDIVSAATPLITLNRKLAFPYTFSDLIMGNTPGTLGETFRLGIIALGLILIVLKIADWRIPLGFVGAVYAINLLGGILSPDKFRDPVLSVLTGGLLFGAFFVATDPVTAPLYSTNKLIYGLGMGAITVLIRNFGTHNEGVIFAIIIMNAVGALLDSMTNSRIKEAGA